MHSHVHMNVVVFYARLDKNNIGQLFNRFLGDSVFQLFNRILTLYRLSM